MERSVGTPSTSGQVRAMHLRSCRRMRSRARDAARSFANAGDNGNGAVSRSSKHAHASSSLLAERPLLEESEYPEVSAREKGIGPNRAVSSSFNPASDFRGSVDGFEADPGRLRLFSGTGNPELAAETAQYLGVPLGDMSIRRFADGEIYVRVNESIRGCDVFLLQPTSPPTNTNLMELLVMTDACHRASARSVTAVLPYFGYARADRKTSGRESIAAKLIANLLTEAGVSRMLTLDIHSLQTIGYFDIPVDHVYGECVLLDYLTSKQMSPSEVVVVSPDVGGVPRARAFAKNLADAPLAIIDKRRTGANAAEVMNLIGEVENKHAVVIDDMIDTAGTLSAGAKLLREKGAKTVTAAATHPVFSPPATDRLSSEQFDEVVVTNSIPLAPERRFSNLTVLSVANLLGETIWRINSEHPVRLSRL